MSFRVGQKVVCINPTGEDFDQTEVQVGRVYTIKGWCRSAEHEDAAGFFLCEVVAGEDEEYCDCFAPEFFRPVTERETDIEIFKRLLVPGTKIVEHVS